MFDTPIIWYLFLGGTGAGALCVFAGADLFFRYRAKKEKASRFTWEASLTRAFLSRGFTLTGIVILLGIFCLLVDLEHPERFYYVIIYPTNSVLTFGAFVLTAALLCAGALAGVSLFNASRVPSIILIVIEILACIFGLCTMVYTGVFLASIEFVSFWANLFLPILFVFSSVSCGLMCAVLCAFFEAPRKRILLFNGFMRLDYFVIVCELLTLAAYVVFGLFFSAEQHRFTELFFGDLGGFFWIGFVLLGVVLPLSFEVAYARIKTVTLPFFTVPLVLIGGYFLRYCMVSVSYL